MKNAMSDFQWVASEFLLRHLSGKLLLTLGILIAVLLATAVRVAIELRKEREDADAGE